MFIKKQTKEKIEKLNKKITEQEKIISLLKVTKNKFSIKT